MAKKNKAAPVGEVPAETPEGEIPNGDGATDAAAPTGEVKAKGAPRARKWNYGIVMESTVSAVEGAAAPKGAVEGFNYIAEAGGSCTVQDFSANVDDWRHALRVLMRGKAAIITDAAGNTYPQEYDHAAATTLREAKAAAKKAKESAEAAAGTEEPVEVE